MKRQKIILSVAALALIAATALLKKYKHVGWHKFPSASK